MQVVWEADTAAFASRKRAARACLPCRKRKKRCNHTFARPPDEEAQANGLESVLPDLQHKDPIRFVGDLNPESVLTDLSTRTTNTTRVSRIGTWIVDPRENQRNSEAEDDVDGNIPSNVETYGRYEGGRRVLTKPHREYLQTAGAFRVLPKATQEALITTYIACIDGLIPIIDGGQFLHAYASGEACLFLTQAICMVACKAEEAASYLRLYDNGPVLEPVLFARSLHTALAAAIKADLVVDRMTKIQVLTLMHLHNDGPGGIEDSSLHLSQAIHDAWTAGLHIHTAGRQLNDQASLLWWSIYVHDRLNACLGGRPIMIANRDIDLGRPPLQGSMRSQSVGIWLRLADLLDQVISFYRPTADPDATGWETEFPSFEDLTTGTDMSYLREDQRIILEIFYNTIAILSCRAGGPSTASYARRIQAGNRIETLVNSVSPTSLPPHPLIPYSVGLALTVSYRALRDHAREPSTTSLQASLTTRCEILESLRTRWWTADAMARLGRKALGNIQKPGATRRSLAMVGEEMDAEVSMCKYGPFDHQAAGTSENDNGNGNALRLLSDAAATHATSNGGVQPFSHTSSTTPDMPQLSGVGTYDPSAFEVVQFQDLDNLFEGFFDLSMPTVFEDPLFGVNFLGSAEDANEEGEGRADLLGSEYVKVGLEDTTGGGEGEEESQYPDLPPQ